MSRKHYNITFSIIVIFLLILTSCGIKAPIQDLEVAKQKIALADEFDAKKYAPGEYAKAEKSLEVGKSTMVTNEKSSKNKDAKKKFEEAKKNADIAFKKAAPKYTEAKINETKDLLKSASDIKANVENKEDFEKSQKLLDDANSLLKKKDYKGAVAKIKESKSIVSNLLQITKERKEKAEKEINEAKNKLDSIQQDLEKKIDEKDNPPTEPMDEGGDNNE